MPVLYRGSAVPKGYFCKLCILIVMFMYSYCYVCSVLYILFSCANWDSLAILTDVFPCFFLSCKANAGVYLKKTRHCPHSS